MDTNRTPKKNQGIRDQMRAYFIVLSIAPLMILGALLLLQSYIVQKEWSISLQRVVAESTATQVRSYILSLENELQLALLTNNFMALDRGDQVRILKYLRFYHNNVHGDVFNSLVFLDGRGTELIRISRTEAHPKTASADWSKADLFTAPAKSGAVHYSPVTFDPATGEPFISLGMPLMDLNSNTAQGVLVAEIRLRDAWRLLERMSIGTTDSLYIIDQSGRVIAHQDPSIVLRGTQIPPPGRPGIRSGLSGNRAVMATGTILLGNQTLTMVAERPALDAFRLTISTFVIIGLLLFILFAGAIILRRHLTRVIVQPVEALSGTALAIANGDLSRQAEPSAGNELGALARSFNAMTEKLVRSIETLDEQQIFLRTVIESLSQPFYVIDAADYRVILANRAACGSGTFEQGSRTCYAMTHGRTGPCTGSDHPCAVPDVKRTGKPAVREHTHALPDGSSKFLDMYAYPVLNAGGEVSHIIEYCNDVTERKRSEDQHRKMLAQLFQMQKMESVGTLAGGVAHDFNNILASVIGYADLARTLEPADSKVQDILGKIVDSGMRAKKLVQQLLAFSSQTDEQRSLVRVQDIIEETLSLLGGSLTGTVELRTDLDRACGPVMAVPLQIHQVLVNLCSNAVHAMHGRSGILTIALHPETITTPSGGPDRSGIPPGDYLRMEVRDTGSGMDTGTLQRIFDPFFTTKGPGSGIGLGLAVVHGIIKGHGGHIAVTSEPNIGTTFTIHLPRFVLTPSPSERTDAGTASVIERPPGGQERIMLVDDDDRSARMSKRMLETLGYQVDVFTSGLDALEAFLAAPGSIDLVIADISMPQMPGTELAGRMRSIRPGTPLILSTGFSELTNADRQFAEGLVHHIMKPFLISEIAVLIRRLLDEAKQAARDNAPMQ